MTMSQTMTEEQLRELIQGPQDVEWKYARRPLSLDWPFLITRAAPPSANDDRYEMRRECQEILPGLILGPLQAAKSLDILRGLGVTHVYVPRSPLQLAIEVTNLAKHVLARSLAFPTGCAFETRKRRSRSNHGSRTSSNTWSLISRIRRNRTSSGTFQREGAPCLDFSASVRLIIYRAKGFIDTAIQGGGRVLVHCNGARSSLSTTSYLH